MNKRIPGQTSARLEFEYDLEARPDTVWRALLDKKFRKKWLPEEDLAMPDAFSVRPGCEVCYRMRASVPPFLESTVIFRIFPNADGGTVLRIIHEPPAACYRRNLRADNANCVLTSLAA